MMMVDDGRGEGLKYDDVITLLCINLSKIVNLRDFSERKEIKLKSKINANINI